jgi:lysophospholipase L1-like esterase
MKILFFVLAGCSLFGQTPAAPVPVTAPVEDTAKLHAELEREHKTLQDWPNLARYRDDNAHLATATGPRVVFMGDSITDAWGHGVDSKFFPGKPYVNRGISGQTTPQMLIRFQPDVVALKPAAVVILAGTNDLAGNTGPMTLEAIEDNFRSMLAIAQMNNIRAVVSSVMPVCDYHRPQTERRPPEKILLLNHWLQEYSTAHGLVYLDYFSAMVDDKGMLKKELTYDGLHPNDAGYAVMAPLAEKAIEQVMSSK